MIQDVLDQFGKTLVDDVRASLLTKQTAKAAKYGNSVNPNSRLSASISYTVYMEGDSVVMNFIMADYWEWVDMGRGPGNVSKSANIERWAQIKGIDPRRKLEEARQARRLKTVKKQRVKILKPVTYKVAVRQFAFVVRRKLKAKGYEANHFYSDVISDGRVELLQKVISEEFKKELNIVFTTQTK